MLANKQINRENIEPGIYDIANEAYHSIGGINSSKIRTFKRTPKHFYDDFLNENSFNKIQTPALRIGSAIGTLLLEPENFNYEVKPDDIDRRTKIGKEKWDEFLKQSEGKIIISKEEHDLIYASVDVIRTHEVAKQIFELKLDIEKSLFWIDNESGMLCKARPDMWSGDKIFELKTTQNASRRSFESTIATYGYHIQAAMQIDAIEALTGIKNNFFSFLVLEKDTHPKVALWQLSEDAIDYGRRIYKKALLQMKECFEKNYWPDYAGQNQIQIVNLPTYAYSEEI